MGYLLALLAVIVFGLLAYWMHLEKGGTGDDAHNTNGKAWLLIILVLGTGMVIGTLPGIHSIVKPIGQFVEQTIYSMLPPAYSENESPANGGAPASASATTTSLHPSTEGKRLMELHFKDIQYVKGDQKFTNFANIGDGWFWNVIDPGLSATVGQKVMSDEYKLADPSAGTPIIYLARIVNGVTEYGDPRPFPLP